MRQQIKSRYEGHQHHLGMSLSPNNVHNSPKMKQKITSKTPNQISISGNHNNIAIGGDSIIFNLNVNTNMKAKIPISTLVYKNMEIREMQKGKQQAKFMPQQKQTSRNQSKISTPALGEEQNEWDHFSQLSQLSFLQSPIPRLLISSVADNYNNPHQMFNQSKLNSRQHSQSRKSPVSNTTRNQSIDKFFVLQTIEQNKLRVSKNFKNMFHLRYVIGIGGFGKVWKVQHKKNNQTFAMKEMNKALVITKKSVSSVMNERILLSQVKHRFIVNMICSFQDRENLYLIMDYLSGGDLRYHIGRERRFTEVQTKFFIACIMLCLEHLHNNFIIHRDIKPENLVLDNLGYLRVTDLGIARLMKPDNSSDTSGTPGYMAPEVMCRMNHNYSVDYFALGVIGYEFMLGKRPYMGRSRKEIRDQILAKQVLIKQDEVPDGWSTSSVDLINGLIQRKPQNRLGANGPQQIKSHSWFNDFRWDLLYNKEIVSPFIPNIKGDNFDSRQIFVEDVENNELIKENILLLRRDSVQSLFEGYTYDEFMGKEQPKKQISQTTNNSHRFTTQQQIEKEFFSSSPLKILFILLFNLMASSSQRNDFDHLVKLLIIGDSGVGKTCMLMRFCENTCTNNHLTTIGIDFKLKTIELGGKKVKLQIWDTAGQERFRTITTTYYKGAHGVILTYGVDDRRSFQEVEHWMKQIKMYALVDVQCMLVGNKSDTTDRVVSTDEGQRLADSFSIQFYETSAKADVNIQKVFQTMGQLCIEKKGDGEQQQQQQKTELNNTKKQVTQKGCC